MKRQNNQVQKKLGLSWSEIEKLLVLSCSQSLCLKELYGWTNTTKFKTKYITPLINEKLVEMSLPDKPTSPNQRYFLTEKGRVLLTNESRTPEVEERLNYSVSRLIDNLNEEEKRIALRLLQGG